MVAMPSAGGGGEVSEPAAAVRAESDRSLVWRVRWTVVLTLTALAIAAGVVALVRLGDSSPTPAPIGVWHRLADAPLSPRAKPLAVWTGQEALFIGGAVQPCAPWVSCDAATADPTGPGNERMLRTGAAYNPATGGWRTIAPAPGFVDQGYPAAYAGGHAFVLTSRGWAAYDVAADSWGDFDPPWDDHYGTSTLGDTVYGLSHGRAIAYDAATGQLTRYPVDHIQPRIGGVSVTGTPAGPVLSGYDVARPNAHPAVVDAWDGHSWRRLPRTGQASWVLTWTGRRLVSVTSGIHGPEHPAARRPWGGAIDRTTGGWSALPTALIYPETSGWDVLSDEWNPATHRGPWFVTHGLVYDDSTERVWPLSRPDGGPDSLASAVWADGKLIVFGGADFSDQTITGLSDGAWIYTP
jgi:hypothetical protein